MNRKLLLFLARVKALLAGNYRVSTTEGSVVNDSIYCLIVSIVSGFGLLEMYFQLARK